MKYWFNDFLDEISENFSKIYIQFRKNKNPEYNPSTNISKNIRTGMVIFFSIIMGVIVISVIKQIQHDLGL